jgi:RimJ/RimL family protein N-acetyltransferase
MLREEEITERNKNHLIKFLKQDMIRHIFAYYDLQHEPQFTATHAIFQNSVVRGYILTYTRTDVQSVVLEADTEAAGHLIRHSPEGNFIIHTPPNLLDTVRQKFPKAKAYVEDWMLVKKKQARLYESENVRRLDTQDDASQLARLLSTRSDRPQRNAEKYAEWLQRMKIYGVFVNSDLVSYAGSFLQTPQVWMIGGVYTDPEKRNRGYSTLAVSAVTREALKSAEAAALFVRSDNSPAVRVYEKIGYSKIGEKLWIDVGTGLRP